MRLILCASIRPSIGTENLIPEEVNYTKITIRVTVMNKVQFLLRSQPQHNIEALIGERSGGWSPCSALTTNRGGKSTVSAYEYSSNSGAVKCTGTDRRFAPLSGQASYLKSETSIGLRLRPISWLA